MSFLLDALRKSEQQRRLGETPKIQVPILGSAESKPRQSRKLLLALGLVIILMLSWLFFLQYSSKDDVAVLADAPANNATGSGSSPETVTSADSPVTGNNQQAQNTPVQTAPALATSDPNRSMVSDTSKPSGSDRLPTALSAQNQEQTVADFDELANQIAAREAQAREIRQKQAQQLAEQQAEAAKVAAQAGNSQVQGAPETNIEPEQLPANTEEEWEPARPTYISYFELPTNVRQSLPEFSISIRVFDELAENRFVIIDRERVFEGDEVPGADGVELVEIKRQSLILEYQGYVFEYQ